MLLIRVATQSIPLPTGKTGGNWFITVRQNGDGVMAPYLGAAPETPFPTTLPAGTYELSGQRLDSNGAPLGPVFAANYDWTGEGAEMVDVAAGISVVNV
jgi:hypothetical protein